VITVMKQKMMVIKQQDSLLGSNVSWLIEYDPNCMLVIGSACPLASHKKA